MNLPIENYSLNSIKFNDILLKSIETSQISKMKNPQEVGYCAIIRNSSNSIGINLRDITSYCLFYVEPLLNNYTLLFKE